MARITKDYDERKNELLDIAQQFFYTQGYAKTPVDAIIEKANVAKGTFYYYFKSKLDLLNAMVHRRSEMILKEVNKVMQDEKLNALQKMNKIFDVAAQIKAIDKKFLKMVIQVSYKDENIMMRHKGLEEAYRMFEPVYEDLIKMGVAEGIFSCEYPRETAEIIVRLFSALRDTNAKLFLSLESTEELTEQIKRKIEVYEDVMEKILGLKAGSVIMIDRNFLKVFISAAYSD